MTPIMQAARARFSTREANSDGPFDAVRTGSHYLLANTATTPGQIPQEPTCVHVTVDELLACKPFALCGA